MVNGEKKPLHQLPRVTPKELKIMLDFLDKLENPPALMVYGVPGIGKTTIIKDFAQEKGYELRVKHLSRMDTTDWTGMPKISNDSKYTEFLPISLFKKNDENRKIVIFFDELNTALPQVLNAALDVILEKRGDGVDAELPPETIIVAAGNLGEEDGTYVEQLSSAVKTRLIQVRLEQTDVKDWLEWAEGKGIHEKVREYIRNKGEIKDLIDLDGFRNNDDQMATPRGWERVSDFLKIYEGNQFSQDERLKKNILRHFIIGTLGKRVGEKFYDFYTEVQEPETESVWRNNLARYSRIYTGNTADWTPENLCNTIYWVSVGLGNNYNGATMEAQKLTDLLIRKAGSLNRNILANLAGRDINHFLHYLENYRQGRDNNIVNTINSIIRLIREIIPQ